MRPFAVAVALVLTTSQSACLFRARPDSFRYYTLASSAEPAVNPASGLTVGLGPVTLPGYLSRPGLVTRVDDTQVRYAEGERWAEPLGKQFTRTLSEDLSRALGGARIVDYPWYPAPIDVAVAVTVLAFEVDTARTATLTAGWSLREPRSRQVGYEGQSAIVEPAAGTPGEAATGDAAVSALSRALARLSHELAVAIVTNTRHR